jgi:hypothetical protein
MEAKLLRVTTPTICGGLEVYWDGKRTSWGRMCPYFKKVVGKMSPAQFIQFLDGTGRRLGWSYEWV